MTEAPGTVTVLEQYKLFVASAQEISARRSAANNYLLSVNSALVAVHGVGSAFNQMPDGNWPSP